MKFVGAMAFIALGYSVAYYGASMWMRYVATGNTSGQGIPLRVLLFGISAVDTTVPNTVMPQSQPPFGATSTTAATTANPSPTPTTPNVQTV